MIKNKKTKEDVKLVFIIIFSFVIGGVVTLGLLKWTPLLSEIIGTSSTGGTLVTKNKTHVYEKSSLAPSVEKIYDATVLVNTYDNNQKEISTGTGFVYKVDDDYGYILTNNHVINDGKSITVVMSNDEEVEAKVLGGDSYLDLAVLQIPRNKVLMVANIGSSEDMKLGDIVFTVGSPMGYEYRGSVTSGVLSGKDRMVSVSVSSSNNDWVMRVLQIDASINPGNSGGPLLNVNGEVIGICSLKLVDDKIEGMGFAIPIEYAMSHVKTLESGKKVEWPLLGIEMVNVTDSVTLYRYRIMLDENIKSGVVVLNAVDGSGAKEAGLKKGDVIIKFAGKEVKDFAYLRYELYQHSAGDIVEVTYLRDGKEKTTKIKLGKSTDQ